MESGLIFNQLICEFESRHPCQDIFDSPIANCRFVNRDSGLSEAISGTKTGSTVFLWVVAQLAEHRTVTAAREGSTPFDPPKSFSLADWRCRWARLKARTNWRSAIENRNGLGVVA
jgi:hypothetical protein